MTEHIYAGVREILTGPEWEPVYVQDAGPFVTISGRFNGRAHAGSRDDWKSLAIDMDRIAREQYAHLLAEAEPIAVEPVVEAAPEPVSYNSGKIDEPEAEAVVEPEPAPVEIEPEPIPEPDPCAALMHELDGLRAENARLRAEANAHNFPANMTDKLSDWDTVSDEGNLTTAPIPEDIAQFMSPNETLADAVERLTPGLDELLGMAEGLSDTSLEMAIAAIPLKRANDWTTRIYDERAVLRTKRGTDGENLGRENLLRRVESVFSRAGSKI